LQQKTGSKRTKLRDMFQNRRKTALMITEAVKIINGP
jgi:hypothetical protein